MPSTTKTVTIGSLSLTLAPLRLGQLKAVQGDLKLMLGTRSTTDIAEMISGERLDAMKNLVFASASAHDATLDRATFDREVDGLAWDSGVKTLAEALAVVMQASGLNTAEGKSSGEAESPATDS